MIFPTKHTIYHTLQKHATVYCLLYPYIPFPTAPCTTPCHLLKQAHPRNKTHYSISVAKTDHYLPTLACNPLPHVKAEAPQEDLILLPTFAMPCHSTLPCIKQSQLTMACQFDIPLPAIPCHMLKQRGPPGTFDIFAKINQITIPCHTLT